MGEVHLAEHRLLKRPCAVKLIRPEHAADDTAKRLDFGLGSETGPVDARLTRLTRTGGVMGTPAYMSTEQARGADAGPASDVYAVGAVGYFLLTGRSPFDGKNPLALLHAH